MEFKVESIKETTKRKEGGETEKAFVAYLTCAGESITVDVKSAENIYSLGDKVELRLVQEQKKLK